MCLMLNINYYFGKNEIWSNICWQDFNILKYNCRLLNQRLGVLKLLKPFSFNLYRFIYLQGILFIYKDYLQEMNNCSSSLFNNNNNEYSSLEWLTFSENQEEKEIRKKRRWTSRRINLTTISFSFIPCLEFSLLL